MEACKVNTEWKPHRTCSTHVFTSSNTMEACKVNTEWKNTDCTCSCHVFTSSNTMEACEVNTERKTQTVPAAAMCSPVLTQWKPAKWTPSEKHRLYLQQPCVHWFWLAGSPQRESAWTGWALWCRNWCKLKHRHTHKPSTPGSHTVYFSLLRFKHRHTHKPSTPGSHTVYFSLLRFKHRHTHKPSTPGSHTVYFSLLRFFPHSTYAWKRKNFTPNPPSLTKSTQKS